MRLIDFAGFPRPLEFWICHHSQTCLFDGSGPTEGRNWSLQSENQANVEVEMRLIRPSWRGVITNKTTCKKHTETPPHPVREERKKINSLCLSFTWTLELCVCVCVCAYVSVWSGYRAVSMQQTLTRGLYIICGGKHTNTSTHICTQEETLKCLHSHTHKHTHTQAPTSHILTTWEPVNHLQVKANFLRPALTPAFPPDTPQNTRTHTHRLVFIPPWIFISWGMCLPHFTFDHIPDIIQFCCSTHQ